MSQELNNSAPEEENLENILKSIRNVIDNRNRNIPPEVSSTPINEEDEPFELTNIIDNNKKATESSADLWLVSEEEKTKSLSVIKDFLEKLTESFYPTEDKTLEHVVSNLMKPLIKDWLDNNLSKLVEKVVTEEIKHLMPKNK